MDSNQTLHDFVLNLMTNQDARTAFELDPEGALQSAGLGDLTPADVQEVVPLVVDLVPVQGVTNLLPVGGDLGLGDLTTAPTAVVGTLQSIVQQVQLGGTTSANADVHVATLGAITVDGSGVGTAATVPASIDVSVHSSTSTSGTVDLSAVNDVSGTLDSGVVQPVVGTVDGVVGDDGLLGGDLLGGVLGGGGSGNGLLGATVDSTLNGVLEGDLGGTVGGTVGGLTGTVDGTLGTVGNVTGGLTGTVDGTLDAVGGVAGLDGTLGVVGNVTGGLTGTLDGVGNVTGSLGLGGEAEASSSGGGLLGLTDGLL